MTERYFWDSEGLQILAPTTEDEIESIHLNGGCTELTQEFMIAVMRHEGFFSFLTEEQKKRALDNRDVSLELIGRPDGVKQSEVPTRYVQQIGRGHRPLDPRCDGLSEMDEDLQSLMDRDRE